VIDPKAKPDEKLSQARELFEDDIDHYDDCNAERHRAGRFYHNSKCEGQWEEEDLETLREQGRPANSFNVVQSKVKTGIGMHKDQQRRAMVEPGGGEDAFLAEVLRALSDRIREHGKVESVKDVVRRNGYIKGEGDVQVDVSGDPDHPGWVRIEVFSASPHDVTWDPASTCLNRSDARYVFWNRWLSKGEFAQEYPEHATDWDSIRKSTGAEPADLTSLLMSEGPYEDRDDDGAKSSSYYWDRYKKLARVVHFEYKSRYQKQFVLMGDGEAVEVDDKEAALIRKDELGQLGDVEITKTWAEKVHVLEFAGPVVLHDSTEHEGAHQPYDGFSLEPFIYALDDEDGTPYGAVRNLFDPQMEINKAWSSSLEHLVGQQRTGVIAEAGAILDLETFEEQLATTGSVAVVKDGALAQGQVQQRTVPQPSMASQQRLENATLVVDKISGISSDLESPASQQEAATTVAIRYHKSQLGLADVRAAFDELDMGIERRILETIVRAMPDDQIQTLLSNDEKYVVAEGTIVEIAPNPQQPDRKVVKQQASLEAMRTLKYDIELSTTTENTTLRLLELQGFMQLFQMGAPVDPVMLVQRAAGSRSDREQLKEFAEQQAQQASQMAQMQAQQVQQQVQQTLQIAAGSEAEKARHNKAEEEFKAEKLATDASVDIAAIVERSDENEKKAILKVFEVVQQRQSDREKAVTSPASRGGYLQ